MKPTVDARKVSSEESPGAGSKKRAPVVAVPVPASRTASAAGGGGGGSTGSPSAAAAAKKKLAVNKEANSSSIVASTKKFRYLALGDSYTIGEELENKSDAFPFQTARFWMGEDDALRLSDCIVETQIIAETGWTCEELKTAIATAEQGQGADKSRRASFIKSALEPIHAPYDIVTLCIGVNNQYRGLSADAYRLEFEELLQKAIELAGNRSDCVVVLSIPDWSYTPFAAVQPDLAKIASAIDEFNRINREITARLACGYVDVTSYSRQIKGDPSLVASDELHYSAKEYQLWARDLAKVVKNRLEGRGEGGCESIWKSVFFWLF